MALRFDKNLAEILKVEEKASISKSCHFFVVRCNCLFSRSVESAVNSFVKDMLGSEETWMVTQAKRRMEKEDVYKKYPSMDPVFMKI